ncbi:hypothetical protein SH139x_002929 [Planctomycetaceae bacterium SH139]
MRLSLHSQSRWRLRLMLAPVGLAALVSLTPSAQAQNGQQNDAGRTTLYGRSVVVRATHTSNAQEGWPTSEEVSLGRAAPDHHTHLVPVPPPSLPAASSPKSNVAAIPGMPAAELWADYQPHNGECQSQTCDCQTGHHRGGKKPLKAVFGKLSAGFDLLIFGTTASGGCDADGCDADGCDTGVCDTVACDDSGCDAIGTGHGLQPFMSHHQHSPPNQHVHPHPHAPIVQPTVPAPRTGTPTPAEHQPTLKRRSVPDERIDPFRDDPISVSGRIKAKPASFRR